MAYRYYQSLLVSQKKNNVERSGDKGISAVPDGNEHMDPDLPVFNGVPEVLHIKFIGKRASIVLETTSDFFSLG